MDYVYSSIFGIYVFDEKFSIIKEKKIENPELLESFLWTVDEKSVIDGILSQKKDVCFIGEKNEKYRDVSFCTDPAVINRVVKAIKNNFDKHFSISLKITKDQISRSLNDDFLLVQAINSIRELEKSINLLCKRVREIYSSYSPEIEKKLSDNDSFIRLIISKSKDELISELSIKESMGTSFEGDDIEQMISLAKSISGLIEEKNKKEEYMEKIVLGLCPNVSAIAGPKIASRLVAQAKSLKRLAFFPSGTVQTLGAEKALFSHLKAKTKPPKHGILMSHQLVMTAPMNKKGKVSRELANKISIAAKVDYFGGGNDINIGYQLISKIEDDAKRFKNT